MTIRDNGNNKSFASAAPSTEEETYDPEAFIVNAADNVFALSVSTTAANNSGYGQLNKSASATTNAGAQTTPIAYSTGQPPQPPSSSSSVAVATGAPMPTPTSTTQFSTIATTSRRNNNSECCTGWTCCGIISIVLLSIFICCISYFIIGIIIVVFTWDST